MRIIYIPIDERPCNTLVVKRIANSSRDLELVMPPIHLLSNKKTPAAVERLWSWIIDNASEVDSLILSLDMLIYGGLIPSRLHEMEKKTGDKWLKRLRDFQRQFPNISIYASNMIMRTPKYSSNDEEPDYYADWGRELFLRAYLTDKEEKHLISEEESRQLQEISHSLPNTYIENYERRRRFNSRMNQCVLELVKDGVVTFLAIPQDDSAEFGYTAKDQHAVLKRRGELQLYNQVHIYPGADEVGATLLARAYNDYYHSTPSIYPIWSSTLGAQLIPLYEDRPFYESLKAHTMAAGCRLTDDPDEADLILAYNTPGKIMQESWEQYQKDITYDSFRNLSMFVENMKGFVCQGKQLIIADSAYANGGDHELIIRLDQAGILDKMLSYKGWNTNGNTLGTTISQGVLGLSHTNTLKIKENIIYHLLDDYFYQAELRMKLAEEILPAYQLTYFDLKDQAEMIDRTRDKLLLERFRETITNSFNQTSINIQTYAPWNRMFECGIELEVQHY
ncbi:DUF4127 family protein [Gracilibacillus timonensis]|uniref:DUF4127 family protein n=1 Tax=Gracilibacillus timonensis TaxID=1816696 RepID=UPI000824CFA8|nr:DUF4127 family protein [Gracilibacillus timonensis]